MDLIFFMVIAKVKTHVISLFACIFKRKLEISLLSARMCDRVIVVTLSVVLSFSTGF